MEMTTTTTKSATIQFEAEVRTLADDRLVATVRTNPGVVQNPQDWTMLAAIVADASDTHGPCIAIPHRIAN